MVALSLIQSYNAHLSTRFLSRLVAVFVGATSGIGEATLKKFALRSHQPRAYFVGRSQDAADRIINECKALNPAGEYTFIQADVSLVHIVDQVCDEIKAKEKILHVLFLSQGVPSFDRSVTTESLHLLAALNYYSRLRFIENLLPLLRQASDLRRVVTVGGGTMEGPLDVSDFPALRVPVSDLRGHLSALITLGLEAVARTAPNVTFIHSYPGTVDTPFLSYMPQETLRALVRSPVGESGDRHLYLATSSQISPAIQHSNDDLTLNRRDVVLRQDTPGGVVGEVYSVGADCEGPTERVKELLADMRARGMVEAVWQHTEGEFSRIQAQHGETSANYQFLHPR